MNITKHLIREALLDLKEGERLLADEILEALLRDGSFNDDMCDCDTDAKDNGELCDCGLAQYLNYEPVSE